MNGLKRWWSSRESTLHLGLANLVCVALNFGTGNYPIAAFCAFAAGWTIALYLAGVSSND